MIRTVDKHIRCLAIMAAMLLSFFATSTVLAAGTVSGTVYQSDGTTPVTGTSVQINVYCGDPCGFTTLIKSANTNSADGTYSIPGLPAGTYFLQSTNNAAYLDEWWSFPSSSGICQNAGAVTVTEGETTADTNFQLDSAAAISGTVYQSDGATPITGGGSVTAYTGDPCGTHSWIASASINTTDGTYTINALPTGTYYLQADAYSNYVREWWADPSSMVECNGAMSIAVTAGGAVTGKNFQLSNGVTISGTVYQSDGATPFTNGGRVYAYAGDPCGSYTSAGSDYINSDGTYSIESPLTAGTYYLRATPYSNSEYSPEWWADPSSVVECNGAMPIAVTAGGVFTGKNFQLDIGATISGTVFQSDGVSPIVGGGSVDVVTGDPCGTYDTVQSTTINSSTGEYESVGLAPGTYYLLSSATGGITGYVSEWWALSESTESCSGAQSVPVTAGEAVTGKTFQLDSAAAISGTVYQSDGATPITGGGSVMAYTGDPCGTHSWVASASINTTDGTYTINNLPAGTYYLQAYAYSDYTSEWWADPSSVVDCSGAQSIAVTAGDTITGKNFQLNTVASTDASISGTAYQSDGVTPIPGGGYVVAYTGDPCGSYSWVGSASINTTDGTYTINNLPTGTYYLQLEATCNYAAEWWADPSSVADCSGAQSIAVIAGGAVAGKNFQLGAGTTISGTVYQNDGTTPITGGGSVYAYTGDPCGSHSWAGSASINTTDGTYMFMGLPAGTYYLNSNTFNYINEWWADPSSVVECSGAQSIAVTAGDTVPNTNFQLDSGSTGITGTVTNDTDGQPVAGVTICGDPFPSGQGGSCTTTQSDGTYTLSGIQSGYTRVTASGAGYLTEYYDNTYDHNWATAVWAPAEQTTSNINFSMGNYGSISGTVAQSNPAIPLANVCVDAYRHLCETNPFASALTDSSGSYTITNLPPQAYYVKIGSACTHPLHYNDVWWQGNTSGEMFCDQAGAVNVTSGQNTNTIDFNLIPSEVTYPGPSFRSAGVFSAHHADESITTTFFAFIDGPSPEDVVSFTATGPSGTFNLTLNQTPFIQLGNIYTTGSESVVDNGTYVFVVTDSLGRTATVERIFAYNSTVPQVDSATMKVDGMGSQSYVGTATPTLTWAAVSWPGTPGYYQVFIYDYDGKAVWYTPETEGTSITVPEGYLQPDTAYKWWVRTGDMPEVGQKGQNRRYSNTLYFYTGTKGLPDLTKRSLLSYHSPSSGWANFFGVSKTNLAPWDIEQYHVTGPKGTVYPYVNRLYLAWYPMFYYAWNPGPAPTPDGTYTFNLKDTDLNTDTQTTNFVYDPASPVPEATRSPALNAYIYTKNPTFSWDPPDRNGTYYYNLRIHDYKQRIHWYSYSTTETSVTLPDTLDGPPGSYKWVIRTYTDPEHKNGAFSSARTFTIPPITPYDYTLPGGTGQITDYRIGSVPSYIGTGADFLKALEKVLGPYDITKWRIYGVDYPNNVEINSAEFASWEVVPGMGFWIISLDATPIQVEGTACPQNNPYKLSLPSDWSLMGLPWSSTSIDIGNIQVTDGTNTYPITSPDNNLTQQCVWHYTGNGEYSGYEKFDLSTDTLQNGTGYFFKVHSSTGVTVIFPTENIRDSGTPERGSTGGEEEPPPPPGREPQPEPFTCPDIASGRLDDKEFPSNADCQYRFNGKLTLGNGVTIKKGAGVTFKAE